MKVMKSSKHVDGKMITKCYKALLLIWCFINYGNSVPIDYCLHPLDKSDCGLKPTPVFSYYKPGSRCEIEMWRGCPTFNKFPDELLCSHHCIGKLLGRADETHEDTMMMEVDENRPFDECRVPMNDGDCGVKEQFKYTFIDNLCIRVAWKGCQSPNMFDDEETCVNSCNPQTTSDLQNQMEDLSTDEVEAMIKILNDVISDVLSDITSTPKIMQMKAKMDISTELSEEKTTKVDTTVEPETTTAETITETAATTTKVVETTTVVLEPTTNIEETTTLETTVAVTKAETTTTQATPETTSTTEPSTTVTTEGNGSAEEVVLT